MSGSVVKILVTPFRPMIIITVMICLLAGSPGFGQLTAADIDSLQALGRAEGWTFTVSQNPATQYAIEELCGLIVPPDWQKTARFDPCTVKRDLPEAFDWREFGGNPPVRNQGGCGSCWAFSTVGALECNIKIVDGETVDLSEQWLVSCNRDNWGCSGGWLAHDYHQWKGDNCGDSGAVMEEHFPYAASDLPCDCPYPHRYFIESWAFIGDEDGIPGVEAMKQAILDYGPISVCVSVNYAFAAYDDGVFNHCSYDPINHAVVLVGWDDNMGIQGAWILRNSWGPNWGMDGYMWIAYGCSSIGYGASYINYLPVEKIAAVNTDILDATGGDGDSIPEGGETVGMVLSFENRYRHDITGLSATISFDDASLTVIQGSAYLGDLQTGDTVTNAGEPFVVDIPAGYVLRNDSMYIELVWNGGTERDTEFVEIVFGGRPILLVDDDNGDNLEQFYTPYLDAMRIPYVLSGQAGGAKANMLLLDRYDFLVWFTGDYRLGPIDLIETLNLRNYLNNGGKLLLSGQGIAAYLASEDPDFLTNYLKADYVSTVFIPVLGDSPEGDIFAPTDSIIIMTNGGANNQTHTDLITAINGGVAEMNYINNPSLGAVSYSGDFQTLFFSFGLEAIGVGSYRWTDRDTIIARSLEFFGVGMPGQIPAVSDLSLATGDFEHVVDHSPVFSWTYFDPMGNPPAGYWMQVTTDRFWMTADMWDSGPVAGSGTEATYAGAELVDGERYYVRARVFNGVLWSDWCSSQIRMNSVPVPTGLTPDDLTELYADSVALCHAGAADSEGDSLTYAYELYADSQMTQLLTQTRNQPGRLGDLSCWPVPIELEGGNDYFWHVCACDMYEDGSWSAPASFRVRGFIYGDANFDGMVNVGDAVYIINFVFKSGPEPEPMEAGDANCDGACNVGDAVYIINFVFKSGSSPGCK